MTILKNIGIKGFLIVLLLALQANVYANGDIDSPVMDDASVQQDKNSMAWPMLPNENIQELAQLFYPKNTYLQRRFIQKTLRLNSKEHPDLTAEDRFASLVSLQVPTLKSLVRTRPIHTNKKPVQQGLAMSYGIQSMQNKVIAGLLQQYEYLLSRNNFLKEELAKLNQKLAHLQEKMQDLKLLFDKTLKSEPPKQVKLKNLGAIKPIAEIGTGSNEPASAISWLEYLRLPWLLPLLGFSIIVLGVSVFLKKRRQQISSSFLASEIAPVQASDLDFDNTWNETELPDSEPFAPQDTGMVVHEIETGSEEYAIELLEETRLLMSVNRYDDAIVHLKESIKASPKASIQPWLYLLDVFRKLNMKDDFEIYANSLHMTFNVMTPLWEARDVAMVIPESLEEFPHIMGKLKNLWPEEPARTYLRDLINDNRGGERGGFGRAVVDEILMLIALLGTRKTLA